MYKLKSPTFFLMKKNGSSNLKNEGKPLLLPGNMKHQKGDLPTTRNNIRNRQIHKMTVFMTLNIRQLRREPMISPSLHREVSGPGTKDVKGEPR